MFSKEIEMTVQELIHTLQTMDPTEEVRVAHPEGGTVPLEKVVVEGPAGGLPTLIAQF
jgi:hypothetical protein